ncbi:hypothetical protein GH714_020550 [Hevea brasiliensis]|uniref:Uncharacterized protein n=1 Tax=Hevea brasiliensis TaxID=3981 RepID=A0A6A6N1G4_HEVBR|nr:hypothetical protein GH714_020550 [Hevea brasiliensis]
MEACFDGSKQSGRLGFTEYHHLGNLILLDFCRSEDLIRIPDLPNTAPNLEVICICISSVSYSNHLRSKVRQLESAWSLNTDICSCSYRDDVEAFLAPGSELWMFNEVPEKEKEKKLTDGGLDICGLESIKLVHWEENAVIRRHLESLPLETFTFDSPEHLPCRDTKSTSLHLSGFCNSSWIREMQQASDKPIIISENLDARTRNLGTSKNEIVIGYRLANAYLAIINPSEKSKPRKWSLDDVFIVILRVLFLPHGLQSKRLPYRDYTKSTSLNLSGFSHSSWIGEMEQASDKSIIIGEILDSWTGNLVSVSRINDCVTKSTGEYGTGNVG